MSEDRRQRLHRLVDQVPEADLLVAAGDLQRYLGPTEKPADLLYRTTGTTDADRATEDKRWEVTRRAQAYRPKRARFHGQLLDTAAAWRKAIATATDTELDERLRFFDTPQGA